MLPATKSHRFSLADVLPNSLQALAGQRGPLSFPPVTHAVVVLVDGLGQSALEARAGHLRTLASRRASDPPISAPFPTTTASALATLTTGTLPGRHGIVGYEVFDPASDRTVNQLRGWPPGAEPGGWQRVTTCFERAAEAGIAAVAIGAPKFADSAFTAAVLRGADYRGAKGIGERFEVAARVLADSERALVYLYIPELDTAGHRAGSGSAAWVAAAEEIDAAIAGFASALGPRQGMLVTADHGAVDVPAEAHLIADPELLTGVRHIGGEPRCLQLYREPDADANRIAAAWREAYPARAWVATRAEAIAAGWFGPVDEAVAPRIGDVLVAARGPVAFYVRADSPSRGMVGQHGSLTADELAVPLLRFGAFAAARSR